MSSEAPPGRPEPPDVWAVLAQYKGAVPAQSAAPTPKPPSDAPPDTTWSRFWKRARPIGRNLAGLTFWTFGLVKLFIVDIDRQIVSRLAPSYLWALDLRSLVAVGLVLLVSFFFWRWKALGFLCYVAFYPLVLLFWSLPYLVIRKRIYKRWMVIFGTINAATALIKNIRYHATSKSAALLASFAIVLSHNDTLICASALVLALVLFWATARVVIQTFRSNTFISAQRSAIEVASRLTKGTITTDNLVQPDGTLVPQQAEQFAARLQLAAISNRALYLWAYKIQQYRESNLTFLFNLLSYALLIVGATAAFALINIAVLKVTPSQYNFSGHPSNMAMALYGLSTLAVSEGGGVSARGDIAIFLRILAGLYGPTFLLTAFVNSVLAARSSRGDAELRELVRDLRRRAREHEQDFRTAVRVGFDEACDRILKLGFGSMLIFLGWIKAALPPDFLNDTAYGDAEPQD